MVTNVLSSTAFFLFFSFRMPRSNIVLMRYQPISEPVWLPVSRVILPRSSRTPTPMRSQSGSVPITMSAFFSFASSTAIASAGAFSGFGDSTVGKRPSKTSCSGTVKKLKPSFFRMTRHEHAARAVQRGIDDLELLRVQILEQFAAAASASRRARGKSCPSPCRASVSLPCLVFGSGVYSSPLIAFTSVMMPVACGSTMPAPSLKFTL